MTKMPILIKDEVKYIIDDLLRKHNQNALIAYLKSIRNEDILKRKVIIMDYCFIYEYVKNYYNHYIGVIPRSYDNNIRENVMTRQVSMWLGRKYTSLSLRQLGEKFKRDHSTVVYAINTINNLIETDKKFAVELAYIETHLKNKYEKSSRPQPQAGVSSTPDQCKEQRV